MKLLIVVDMQNDFIAGALGTPEALKIVPYVKQRIQSFDGKVVFTLDTHDDSYLKHEEGKHLPVLHCIKGTWGHQLHQDLLPYAIKTRAKLIEKHTFGSKELIDYLNELNFQEQISSIELLGLCTDICVISNALLIKTYFPDIPISVDASGSAGVTPTSHQNALEAMKMCHIEIKNN